MVLEKRTREDPASSPRVKQPLLRLSSPSELWGFDSEKQTQVWLSSLSLFSFSTFSDHVSTGKPHGIHLSLAPQLLCPFWMGREVKQSRKQENTIPEYFQCRENCDNLPLVSIPKAHCQKWNLDSLYLFAFPSGINPISLFGLSCQDCWKNMWHQKQRDSFPKFRYSIVRILLHMQPNCKPIFLLSLQMAFSCLWYYCII